MQSCQAPYFQEAKTLAQSESGVVPFLKKDSLLRTYSLTRKVTKTALTSLLSKYCIPLAISDAICKSCLSVSLDHMLVYDGCSCSMLL